MSFVCQCARGSEVFGRGGEEVVKKQVNMGPYVSEAALFNSVNSEYINERIRTCFV